MQNQLMKADNLPVADTMNMGKVFYESGMFQDIKSAAQAIVKIQAGQEIGLPPFASMSGIHIIKGKPSIGANILAGRVKASGKYDYAVKALSKTVCELEFFQNGKAQGTSKFTIEDARRAGTQNIDRFPENMLFARAISNGVKWYCPDIFSGPVYTPEEIEAGDVPTVDAPAIVTDAAPNAPAMQATPIPPTPKEPETPQPEDTRETLDAFHPKFNDVVNAIQNQGYKVEHVEKKYKLSDDMRAELAKLVPAPAAQATHAPAPTTQATTKRRPF